jgi:hypothetical protein
MSNTENNQDATTLALWRAAEAGEFGEVEAVLASGADVNARNEHGVTALMRAAQRGHARVVRLLLIHGADANIIRNDKFTALSLAAFFGHTGVVRVLMEHGADSKASTRHGTSPHMWATARTFNEVVDQLKHPAPPRGEERTVPVVERFAPAKPLPLPTRETVTPVAPRPVTAAIVRTLKDPPEIWDLVHEEQKGFNASSTFMEHLHSMRRASLFRLATIVVLICAGVVGVLMLRGAQARSEARSEQAKDSSSTVNSQTENKVVENASVQPAVVSPADAPTFVAPPPVSSVPTESFRTPTSQRRRSHSWVAGSRGGDAESARPAVISESVQRIPNQNDKTNASNEKSDVAKPTTKADINTRSSSPLSPQLITPAKNVAPKTKVIQWP